MPNLENKIWFDGKLVPATAAQVNVLTHALHYGSAVFEGEQVYSGRIFKLAEHTERLFYSAGRLGMKVAFDGQALERATRDVVAANRVGNGYVRPLVWRGSETIAVSAPNTTIHVMIAAWDTLPPYDKEACAMGIRMKTSDWVRPPPNVAPTDAKAAGLYVTSTLAKHAAEDAGYDDALMLDYRGQVAEATLANIFLVIDRALHTPIPDCFLNGITRQTVIELADELGIPVVERVVFPRDFERATEVFVTGTAAEVTPVREIDDFRFESRDVTELIIGAFESLTGKGRAVPEPVETMK